MIHCKVVPCYWPDGTRREPQKLSIKIADACVTSKTRNIQTTYYRLVSRLKMLC
jgi:hypothetical protein